MQPIANDSVGPVNVSSTAPTAVPSPTSVPSEQRPFDWKIAVGSIGAVLCAFVFGLASYKLFKKCDTGNASPKRPREPKQRSEQPNVDMPEPEHADDPSISEAARAELSKTMLPEYDINDVCLTAHPQRSFYLVH